MRAKINHGRKGYKIETLLRKYEFKCPREWYDYIIESYENGHTDQVIELFNLMKEYDQKTFLLNVSYSANIFGEKIHDLIIKNL